MNPLRILLGAALVAACNQTPPPAAAKAEAKVEPAAAPAETETKAAAAQPLSEEDERLIAADPKTLTPEERRKRAYAMRRKIMQNPDSETAKMLQDLQRAAENGELQPPGADGKPQFQTRTAPGVPPAGASPPAGSPEPDDGATKAP